MANLLPNDACSDQFYATWKLRDASPEMGQKYSPLLTVKDGTGADGIVSFEKMKNAPGDYIEYVWVLDQDGVVIAVGGKYKETEEARLQFPIPKFTTRRDAYCKASDGKVWRGGATARSG